MTGDTERIVLEALREALKLAIENLYRVYGAPGDHDHDEAFRRGVAKHAADYEHMVDLIKRRKLV